MFSVVLFCACSMAASLVYRPEFYNSDFGEESLRLLAQVQMGYAAEVDVIRKDLEHVSTLLEVGCGPAHYSERLLREFRHLTIVCVEVDKRFAAIASERLGPLFSARFRIIVGDVLEVLCLLTDTPLSCFILFFARTKLGSAFCS
jgi:hypothetical protein